jgi:AbrB family looped-hinge helix DNA binding protein
METSEGEASKVYRARLDSSGRIVLPASVRERLGVSDGDSVLVVEEDHGYRIETAGQALQEAQAYFASLVPPSVSLVDELLQERRQEAARE